MHNLVVDQGITALLYNMIAGTASNGGQVNRIVWSTSTATPLVTDTAVASVVLTSELIGGGYTSQGTAYWRFYLPFDPDDELGVEGDTLAKVALRTHDSGMATASDDKIIAVALLDPPVVKDAYTAVEGVWVISFRTVVPEPPPIEDPETYTLLWPRFQASKLVSLGDYGVMDHVAFGDGVYEGTPSPEDKELAAEEGAARVASTYTIDGHTIKTSGNLAVGTISGVLTECGPAIGATPNEGVLARKTGFSVNNAVFLVSYIMWFEITRG